MRKELTDITLVVDRSGSMSEIKSDAEGGINEFVKTQAAQPGQASLTLVQFDVEYEFVHRAIPIADAPPYRLQPRGMTALLDAVGRSIHEAGERLAAMKPEDRPGLVVFVIMTDGKENSSVEFTKSQVKKLIEHQQAKYSWKFIFLGADQDAFADAQSMGMMQELASPYAKDKICSAFRGTASVVRRMREKSGKGETVDDGFTAEERDAMS